MLVPWLTRKRPQPTGRGLFRVSQQYKYCVGYQRVVLPLVVPVVVVPVVVVPEVVVPLVAPVVVPSVVPLVVPVVLPEVLIVVLPLVVPEVVPSEVEGVSVLVEEQAERTAALKTKAERPRANIRLVDFIVGWVGR